MDSWTIIAICLIVPAMLFLLIAAIVSALRMPRPQLRALVFSGLASIPIAIVCAWMQDQPWLVSPWESVVNLVGEVAGFVVAYALIAVITVAIRHSVGLTKGCR